MNDERADLLLLNASNLYQSNVRIRAEYRELLFGTGPPAKAAT